MEQDDDEKTDEKLMGLNAMKFMKVAKEKQVQKDMDDAYKLINQLENQDSDHIAIDSDEEEEKEKEKLSSRRKKSATNEHEQQISRKVYGNDNLEAKKTNEILVGKKQFIKKNIHQALLLSDNVD